jgi:hypothetical protein
VIGFCGPVCVVMAIVMLFRLDLYTGRTVTRWEETHDTSSVWPELHGRPRRQCTAESD